MPSSQPDFQPVVAGNCHAQTAADRFGEDGRRAIADREVVGLGLQPGGNELPFTWPDTEDDDDQDQDIAPSFVPSIYRLVPSTQKYRNNLTALSQVDNLYFAAYQGHIFVYVPRSVPKQTLPQHPDLRLYPKSSKVALLVGGYVDTQYPHTINHIITGYLGQEEVVVAGYDDGDVVAYYVKDVAKVLSGTNSTANLPFLQSSIVSSASESAVPVPFLHENVGLSAWGLAVHQKSRLIAVSSNRCEVTVFAPALNTDAKNKFESQACECIKCNRSHEARVRRRLRNWRIVLLLGPLAHNIPNLTFTDDENGFADKICAVDIKGAVWIVDIWKKSLAAVRIVPSTHPLFRSQESWPAQSMGWGVMMLPERSFVTVNSLEEMIGQSTESLDVLPPQASCHQPLVNLAARLYNLPGNPCKFEGVDPMPQRAFQVEDATPNLSQFEINMPLLVSEDGMTDVSGTDAGGSEEHIGEELESLNMDTELQGTHDDNNVSQQTNDDELQNLLNTDETHDVMDESSSDTGFGSEANADGETSDPSDPQNPELTTTLVSVGNIMPTNPAQALAATTPQDFASAFHQTSWGLDTALEQFADAIWDFEDAAAAVPPESDASSDHISLHSSPSLSPSSPQDHLVASLSPSLSKRPRNLETWDNCRACQPNTDKSSPKVLQDMIYFPHNGSVMPLPKTTTDLLEFLSRPSEFHDTYTGHGDGIEGISGRYQMLRTYEKDLELRSLDKKGLVARNKLGMLCPNTITMHDEPPPPIQRLFRATSRLNMMAHIPELSLVIIGSPIGRVLLLTPTRLRSPLQDRAGYWQHGLRVELILPRASDEDKHRRQMRPLHGMAVGPVQEGGQGTTGGDRLGPRRYRLMLHYRNHDMLTYEIMREGETGGVCVL